MLTPRQILGGVAMKAVFTTKVDPTYDDLPEDRYHFPQTYLGVAERSIGDWILYYEPRRSSGDPSSRGGRQAYFATARVSGIRPDPTMRGHFHAFVEDYLPLPRPVPFREGAHFFEASLRRADGQTSKGAFGRSVRALSDAEYDAILRAGMAPVMDFGSPAEPRPRAPALGFGEEPETFERPMVERLTARPLRDAAFAAAVKEAYRDTCAVTGLRLINGGGRAEVQAAHIRPVASQGPDSPRNGLALSSTVHWMFDRGLISIAEDSTLLVAERLVPAGARRLFVPDGRLLLPERQDLRPHPQFLSWHRASVFKG
jgi:putative restriction endonuclease